MKINENYADTCEGHFKIECLDKDNNVIDSFESKNMIVTSARQSMAEIFFRSDCKYAHKLVLGTNGCKDNQIFKAKDENDGLSKNRTKIFSETEGVIYEEGTLVDELLKGDIVAVNVGEVVKYFRSNENYTNVVLDSNTLADFTEVNEPYTYTITFNLTGINSTLYDNLCTSGRNDIVKAEQKDTSVIFTFYVDTENGNQQLTDTQDYDTPTTLFNEAGLYVNDRLFAIRTFPSKVKDGSVKLRIIWSITF